MLHIHFSNRFEVLAEQLLSRLAQEPAAPLQAQHVIVPSAAVRRRLALLHADRHGVCAQVRFDYLARWLWEHLRGLAGDVRGPWPFESGALKWAVYEELQDGGWTDEHPRLAGFLAAGDERMRFELAEQVASVLDQYLTYRPEWLDAWARGEPGYEPADAQAREDRDWQAALWRRLSERLETGGAHPALHFVEALASAAPGALGARLPPSLHVFALPTIPPLHVRLLALLGRHAQVHVYALNPCEEYWFDVVDPRRLAYLAARGRAQHLEVGHSLLARWGRQAQSLLALLVDAAGEQAVDDAQFVEPTGSTLLERWQAGILRLTEPAPGSLVLDPADRSIEVHVCHSRMRELEVLHDRLLGLFAQDPSLAPGDVLVATPDLESVAPLVDAVFGTAPRERYIPYSITGRGDARLRTVAKVLLDALELMDSRFPASGVYGLLQQAPVARRFGLDSSALEAVHAWLKDAAVHWALDADHRAGMGLPARERHTWADGLERLVLGHALPDGWQQPFLGKLPALGVEGGEASALGGLWAYVRALATLRERLAQPWPARAWPQLLADVLAALVAAADDELDDLREVHQAIDALAAQWHAAGTDDSRPLPLAVVREALADVLEDAARGGVPTGAVTFTSMHSLRQLPYRVVCIVGMDDGAYPSSGRPPEFDLVALAPRAGDRQRALDERNVFLDLLLAARDVVHLSHVGRSVRDNAPLPPSVLVSELLDLLVAAIAPAPTDPASLAQARRRLVVEHPLQPFSIEAFRTDADPRTRSHRAEYADALRRLAQHTRAPTAEEAAPSDAGVEVFGDLADEDAADDAVGAVTGGAAPAFFTARLPEPEPPWREVALADLVRFFRHPCRYLLERRLGLVLPEAPDELDDDEPFVPKRPMQWALADRLLPPLLAGESPDRVRAWAEAGTDLPAGAPGTRWLERELRELFAFAGRLRPWQVGPLLEPHAFRIPVPLYGSETWTLHGAHTPLRAQGLVQWRYGERQPSDLLAAWIAHLALCADPPPGVEPKTHLLTLDVHACFRRCERPMDHLRDLLELYRQGLCEPLYFFPRTAWAVVEYDENPHKAAQVWLPQQDRRGESQDAALRLALRGRPDPLEGPGWEALLNAARRVYGPLRAHLSETQPTQVQEEA